jgi:hypothetical protein
LKRILTILEEDNYSRIFCRRHHQDVDYRIGKEESIQDIREMIGVYTGYKTARYGENGLIGRCGDGLLESCRYMDSVSIFIEDILKNTLINRR